MIHDIIRIGCLALIALVLCATLLALCTVSVVV